MGSSERIASTPSAMEYEAARSAGFKELLAMYGCLREAYEEFGGVEAVIRDRHGVDAGDDEV